ncbi:MAG: GNAT family protein [Oscillospiraceae bacterium]
MIVGKKVSLRAVCREDLPLLMEWRNREDFRQYFREYQELNIENQQAWFENSVVRDRNTIMFTVVLNDEGHTPIGCCGLCYINWVNRFADLSLYIGKDGVYIDSEGYAKEACELLFRYGFGELNLHKLWTEIYEFDAPKNKLYLELGLHQDGLLRENYVHQGKWHNSRIMSILAEDWQG